MFREAIDTLAGSGRVDILLDCTRLGFMDSAGIGELVAGSDAGPSDVVFDGRLASGT